MYQWGERPSFVPVKLNDDPELKLRAKLPIKFPANSFVRKERRRRGIQKASSGSLRFCVTI